MREIKFRAWHQEGLSKPEDNKYSMTYWKLGQGLDNSWFYSHSKAIMQFTGLHDKNGKEIYEGDIIECKGHRPGEHCVGEMKYEVDKDGLTAEWSFGSVGWHAYEIEVIGNIHENPELLTKEVTKMTKELKLLKSKGYKIVKESE